MAMISVLVEPCPIPMLHLHLDCTLRLYAARTNTAVCFISLVCMTATVVLFLRFHTT